MPAKELDDPELERKETVEKSERAPKTGLPAPPARARGRARAMLVVLLIGAVLAVGGYSYWRYAQTYESTDDAQVDAHLNGISARIPGTIAAVHVEENQLVKAGDLVAEIDPRDYQVALDQARAELAQKQAEIRAQNPNVPIVTVSSQANIEAARADVANAEAAVAAAERDYVAAQGRLHEAEANNLKAQQDRARYQELANKDEIAKQIYDQSVTSANATAAAVETARASAEAAQKIVDQRKAQLELSRSRLSEAAANAPHQREASQANVAAKAADANVAKTQVEQALLNLSYTKIYSPVSGVVAKRTVEVGNRVQPGQQLFLISQIDNLWVTADFKETQLRRIHPGQRVSISVDAFDQKFNGYVDSMPGATGPIMSLLPPENATGNYVKVVQRLPVRIRFDKNQAGLEKLRPGMSVEPKVFLK
ncbi:MAG TPA: HlyD family secretion protein [Bryobacteraceae bacterium]|nr:HlyD family secretion protein [Bryobacteraceae bacterium]